MSDLVERLREVFHQRRYGPNAEYDPDFDLFDVAADKIELLRAALQAINHDCGGIRCDGCRNAVEIARRALEGK